MRNIFLTGLSGCGKTTLGQELSLKSGREFIDTDAIIEKETGKKITDIFAAEGESGFRRRENDIIRRCGGEQKNRVISLGGGAVLREDNMKIAEENGIIVFIDKSPAKIAREINTQNRPLLKNNPAEIFNLHRARIHLYEKYGDFRLENNGELKPALELLTEIAAINQHYQSAKRFGVIGFPAKHSLSPVIHMPVLKRFYGNLSYSVREIEKNALARWLKDEGNAWDGFNITMPHKEDIIAFLSKISPSGEILRSINTAFALKEGGFGGESTDGAGFIKALKENGISSDKARITVLGAGGAAAAVSLAALSSASRLNIAARNKTQGELLVKRLKKAGAKGEISAVLNAASVMRETDILINATPRGMKGFAQFDDFSFLNALPDNAAVCDLIYDPAETELLKEAAKRGLKRLNGLPMLIYQALYADRIFVHHTLMLKTPYEKAVSALKSEGGMI